jgi:hypothetical protein
MCYTHTERNSPLHLSYGDGFIKSIFHKDEIGFVSCTRIMGHLCFICLARNCKQFVMTLILFLRIFNAKLLAHISAS